MLVVLEGVDGAGKATQLALVSDLLRRSGLEVEVTSFPRYQQGVFGASVARFLNGELGDPRAVPPQLPALLFACDRLEHRRALLESLDRADLVLADRYVASNAAYQGARLTGEARAAFLAWLLEVEYGVFELPRPTLQVYLRVEVATAQRLVAGKRQRVYTSMAYDVFENDADLQRAAAELYEDFVAAGFGGPWTSVEVSDPSGQPLPADAIALAVAHSVIERLRLAEERSRGV